MAAANYWWQVVSAVVVLVLSCLIVQLLRLRLKKRRAAGASSCFPRGPWAWPVLGHLPLLKAGFPHHTLAGLSLQHGYGPIIGLRLGSKRAVVACNAALAKELLLTHDKGLLDRPHFQFIDHLFYGSNNSAFCSSYGPRWVKLRKIYSLELFTTKRLQELQHVRQDSVRGLLQRLDEASAGGMRAIQLIDLFGEMSSHTLNRLVHSKTLSDQGGGECESFPKLMADVEHEMAPTLGDFIPWLKCLDFLRLRRMKAIHARIDHIIDSIISERRQAMAEGRQLPREAHSDFLQVLLSKEVTTNDDQGLQHEADLLTTEEIKGSMLDILLGGIHTTALTLEWAMAELLRNPSCLSKLQEEIDVVMGGGMKGEGVELVRDEHLPHLPYLESITKEVFRLHPAAPLLGPRTTSILEVKVDRYTLPAHTQVMVNAWAIGRDPQVWGPNAHQFVPERFQGNNIEMDVKGHHFDLLPFGAGRRMCPGVRLALSVFQVTLANLVKSFDWELPHGQSPTSIEMREKRGLASSKATSLLAIPHRRGSFPLNLC